MSPTDPSPSDKAPGQLEQVAGPLDSVAVIGGGPAGFVAAAALVAAGVEVTLFDRGRSPGGRAGTRKSRSGVAFDHGAPCFSPGSEAFSRHLDAWRAAGVVDAWRGRFLRADPGGKRDASAAAAEDSSATEPAESPPVKWRPDPRDRFVGVPAMASLVEHLAAGAGAARVQSQSEIVGLLGEPAGRGSAGPWLLLDGEGHEHGPFDAVVVAVAAPQAARLLAESSPRVARLAERARAAASYAVMLAFDEPLGLAPHAADVAEGADPGELDGVRLDRGPLSWAHRETRKPGRGADSSAECWVLHARPTWAADFVDGEADAVIAPLKAAFEPLLGRELPPTSYEAAHRWKFAHCTKPLPDPSFVSAKHGLAACGDWFGGPEGLGGLEAAVCSAAHAAETLLKARRASAEPAKPS